MTDERLVIAERALAAEQRGDWTAAHNAWTDLLVVHPDHGEAHFRLGLAAVRLSAFGAAEAELRRALDLFEAQRPQDPRPLIALAELAMRAKRYERAADFLRRALAKQDSAAARDLLAECERHSS